MFGEWDGFDVVPKWQQVPSRSSSDAEPSKSFHINSEYESIQPRSRIKYLVPGLVFFNVATLGILVYLAFASRSCNPNQRNAALKATSYYSPVLDWLDIPTHTVKLNGTLFPPENLDLGRKDPSPEVNAQWQFYEEIRTHIISKEDVIKLGKDPEKVGKFKDDYWGFGDDAYMGEMDVFHQIHCLNMMRQAIFETFDGSSEVDHDYMYWTHLEHCIDITLQNIKCHASTDILTVVWMEARPQPWVDFSINKKCRDFDKLVQFNLEHSVNTAKFNAMPKPNDAYIYPAPWIKHDEELGVKLAPMVQREGVKLSHKGNESHGGH